MNYSFENGYSLDLLCDKLKLQIPRFLNSRLLFYFVIMVLVAKIFIISISLNFPKYVFFADISKTELVKMVNSQRSVLGIKPLSENSKLDWAATLKAKDMLQNGYFAHQSPAGTTPWFWFKKIGYNYKYAGENLAIGFAESIDVYNAWFDSDSHRENFLSSNYNEVGTAVLTGSFEGSTATVVVQLFGKQKTVATTATAKITPKAVQQNVILNKTGSMTVDSQNTVKVTPTPQKPKEVLSAQDTTLAIKESTGTTEVRPYRAILNSIFYDYDSLLQKTIYAIFIIVSIIAILNILINYNFQNKKLAVKSLVMVLLLCAGTFLDGDVLIKIISQNAI